VCRQPTFCRPGSTGLVAGRAWVATTRKGEDMAGRWQWSLRAWVVWMPLVVAVVLALMTPDFYAPGDLREFCGMVWVTFPTALAAGAIMRVKFPNRRISFWIAVGLARPQCCPDTTALPPAHTVIPYPNWHRPLVASFPRQGFYALAHPLPQRSSAPCWRCGYSRPSKAVRTVEHTSATVS
jgi:hypothetical protein